MMKNVSKIAGELFFAERETEPEIEPNETPGTTPGQKPEVEPDALPQEEPGIQPGTKPGKQDDDDDDDNPFTETEIGDDPDEISKKTTIMQSPYLKFGN